MPAGPFSLTLPAVSSSSLPLSSPVILLGLLLIAGPAARLARKGARQAVCWWRSRVTVGGVAASALVAFIATLLRPGDFWRAYPLVTYLGVYAVMLAAMTAVLARWCGQVEREPHARRGMAPGVAYRRSLSVACRARRSSSCSDLRWPWLAVAFERRSPRSGLRCSPFSRTLIQFLMFAELLALIEMLLMDGPLWAVAPLAALAALPAAGRVGTRPTAAGDCRAARHRGRFMDGCDDPASIQRGTAGSPSASTISATPITTALPGASPPSKRRCRPAIPANGEKACCLTTDATRWISQGAAARHAGADRETGCERCSRRAPPRPDRPLPGRRRCGHDPLRRRHEVARARSARIAETHSCDR